MFKTVFEIVGRIGLFVFVTGSLIQVGFLLARVTGVLA
jgi:hypothetical protein